MFRDLWFPVDNASSSGTQSRSGESPAKPPANRQRNKKERRQSAALSLTEVGFA
jgi:hypothetical protein